MVRFQEKKREIVQNVGLFAVELRLKLAQKCYKSFRSDFETGFGFSKS